MKESQQADQINYNIKERTGSVMRYKRIKPRFCAISARHFRANSYVPLLLALRPRAWVTERSVNRTSFVQYAGQKQHFYQFCPLRWVKSGFLSRLKDRNSNLATWFSTLLIFLTLILGDGLLGPVMSPSPASATSLTISIPSTPLTLDIKPTSIEGTFARTAVGATVSVKTDSPAGYTFTIKSSSSSNDLVHSTIPTIKLPSISEVDAGINGLSEEQYKAAGSYLNTWAYLPSKLNSSDNTTFRPAPTSNPTTIDVTTGSNADLVDSPSGTSYTFNLGAKVGPSLPAGTYTNTFTFTAIANELTYSIDYDANGGTNGPADVTEARTVNDTIELSDITPTLAYHQFLGWCTTTPTLVKPSNLDTVNWHDTCEGGTQYNAGATIKLDTVTTNLHIYAMWEEQYTTFDMAYQNAGKQQQTLDGQTYYKMQDMEPSICTSVTMPSDRSTATLIDTRDNNTYTVAKLKDDKCWMTKNLQIENKTISSSDSDVSPENGEFNIPASNSTSVFNSNTTASVYVDGTYGGYYTYAAATADTGNFLTTDGEIVPGSICPKVWRLPTQAEFDALISAYGAGSNGDKLTQAPVSMLYGGWYIGGSASYQGSNGLYWSSIADDSGSAYRLDFIRSRATTYNRSRFGYSVRCVAR